MSYKKITLILFLSIFLSAERSATAQLSQTYPYSGTVQSWTVPTCVNSITIMATGAQGNGDNSTFGLGAKIIGTFTVTSGNVLKVMVGSEGADDVNNGAGGGGGSFVWNSSQSNTLMIAAGGGGGGTVNDAATYGGGGSATTTPTSGWGTYTAAGGTGGNGGSGGSNGVGTYSGAGGGCGWLSNGANGTPGSNSNPAGGGGADPLNGGAGGIAAQNWGAVGGYGGGGGGGISGGGGGGYNGGGGGTAYPISPSTCGGGGGGGSFNGGTNQTNTGAINTGNGSVTIYYSTGASLSMSVINNDSCLSQSNGRASVTVVGGSPPFTYAWTPGGQTTSTATGLSAGTYTVSVSASCGTASASVTITQPNLLSASTTIVNNVQCNGGSNGKIMANAISGGAPYTYLWTPGGQTTALAAGLSIGTYSVTINDRCGNTASAQATITQPAVMTAAVASPVLNVACRGNSTGSATVSSITGGGAPFTYLWVPSSETTVTATGLSAGNYVVTVNDACGATVTAGVSITQPLTAVSVSASTVTNVSCNGQTQGQVTCVASGGTGAYTYSWSPSGQTNATATNLGANTYIVTVKDNNGCTATASTVVTQPNVLSVTAITTANIACRGGSTGATTESVSGGTAPYAYNWTPAGGTNAAAVNLSASTYTVTVTDAHGCTASSAATVTQPNALSIVASVTANEVCNGNSVGSTQVVTSFGTSPYTYNWTPTGGTLATATALTAGVYTITVKDFCGATVSAAVTVTQPAVVKDSIYTISNVICNSQLNGSVGSKASGGTGAFTYSWAPVVSSTDTTTGLSIGTYTLTVKDNRGCSVTAATTVTQPNVLAVSGIITANVLCNGENNGSAGTKVSGGTLPYTYSWSPIAVGKLDTATGLIAGTYTVNVVDKHGCTASTTVTITQPPVLTVVTNAPLNVICNGGSNGKATASVKGGTTPYTYAWSNRATADSTTGLSAGTYTLTVWDLHGCTVTSSITITQPIHLAVGAATVLNNLCYDDSIGTVVAYVAGGPAPYAYVWTPTGGIGDSARKLGIGVYTVNVVDKDGCTGSASTTVTQPAKLDIQLDNVPDDGACTGAAWVSVTGGVTPYKYAWTDGNTTYKITSQCQGNYCCIITDANGCMDDVCADITSYLGVGNVTSGTAKIRVYPNPSTGLFTVSMSGAEGGAEIEVYDVLGAKVYSSVMNSSNTTTMNLGSQPNGIYLYRVISSTNGSLLGEGKIALEK